MNLDDTYRKFSQYYDPYVGDFDADLPVYKSLCRPQESILEVGCGTGRILQSFLQDGFNKMMQIFLPIFALFFSNHIQLLRPTGKCARSGLNASGKLTRMTGFPISSLGR